MGFFSDTSKTLLPRQFILKSVILLLFCCTVNPLLAYFLPQPLEFSITCPPSIVQPADDNCQAIVTWNDPVVVDDDNTNPSIIASAVSGSVFDLGTTTVTYVLGNSNGDTAICSFSVEIFDSSPPVTTCPENVEINMIGGVVSDVSGIIKGVQSNNCQDVTVIFAFPEGIDACDDAPHLVDSTILGGQYAVGIHPITYELTDENDNTTSCYFELTVTKSIAVGGFEAYVTQNLACPGGAITFSTDITDPAAGFEWEGPWFNSPEPTPTIYDFQSVFVGDYSVTVTTGGCVYSLETPISISMAQAPIAQNDQYQMVLNAADTLKVTDNDHFVNLVHTQIEVMPSRGTAEVVGGHILYEPKAGYTGFDQIVYKICVTGCPELCSQAIASIQVGFSAEECIVPTFISPNDDNVNDELIIECLTEDKPDNKLIVFNQWGGSVYEAAPYENNWKGTYNSLDGESLPDGTYYYIFWEEYGVSEEIKGFITLFR